MVLGKLVELALPEPEDSAVAQVAGIHMVLPEGQHGQGGTHPVGVQGEGGAPHLQIHLLGGFVGKIAVAVAIDAVEPRKQGLGSHKGSGLAVGLAAHAVEYGQALPLFGGGGEGQGGGQAHVPLLQAQVIKKEIILIVAAHIAGVAVAGSVDGKSH